MRTGDRFSNSYLKSHDAWVIEDHKYQQDNLVRNWRTKGVHRKLWTGTEQDADALCDLLNKAGEESHEYITNGGRSRSQRIMFGNIQREKTIQKKAAKKVAVVIAQFKKCKCGMNYKGDKHCD